MVNPLTGQSDYRSALAQQLMAQGTQQQPIRTIGQGLGQLGQALSGALIQRGVQKDRQAALAEVLAARDSGQGFEQLMESDNPYAQQFGAQALMADMSREPEYVEVIGPEGNPILMDASQAAAQGLAPAGARTFEQEAMLRQLGAPRTNVSMSPVLDMAGNEFWEAWGKGLGPQLIDQANAANQAQQSNMIIGRARDVLQEVDTNSLSGLRAGVTNIFNAAGLNTENFPGLLRLEDAQSIGELQQLGAQLGVDAAQQFTGALAEEELRIALQTVLNPNATRGESIRILDNLERRNLTRIQQLKEGTIYRSGNDLVRFRNGRFEDVDPAEVENANR